MKLNYSLNRPAESCFFPFLSLSGSDDPEPLSTDEEDEEVARGRLFQKAKGIEQENFLKKHYEMGSYNKKFML